MNKKVTIQDVAQAAGVCKATVSYVLNDNQNQSISEETKKKVWQVVNMLNYRPNAFAQNMRVNHEKRMIAIYFSANLSALEKLLYFDFLQELKNVFYANNYDMVLLDSAPTRVNTSDAIIACGVTREEFFALGGVNFIPLVAVDCEINDPLFFEICYDYGKLKQYADSFFTQNYSFVCTAPRDEKVKAAITSVFPDVIFVGKISDLANVNARNVLVTQEAVQEALSGLKGCNVCYPCELLSLKAAKTAECVKLALSHEPIAQHVFKI